MKEQHCQNKAFFDFDSNKGNLTLTKECFCQFVNAMIVYFGRLVVVL